LFLLVLSEAYVEPGLRLPDFLAQPIAEAIAEWRLLPVLRQPQLVGEIDWVGRQERKLLGYVLGLLGNALPPSWLTLVRPRDSQS
jgi:hypothetical protein